MSTWQDLKKRLDGLLSPPVAALPAAALEALTHGLDQRGAALLVAARRVLPATGGDVAVNAVLIEGFQAGLRAMVPRLVAGLEARVRPANRPAL